MISGMLNALREEGTRDDCLAMIETLLTHREETPSRPRSRVCGRRWRRWRNSSSAGIPAQSLRE